MTIITGSLGPCDASLPLFSAETGALSVLDWRRNSHTSFCPRFFHRPAFSHVIPCSINVLARFDASVTGPELSTLLVDLIRHCEIDDDDVLAILAEGRCNVPGVLSVILRIFFFLRG